MLTVSRFQLGDRNEKTEVSLLSHSRENQCKRAVRSRRGRAFFLASLPELFSKIEIGLRNFVWVSGADMSFRRLPGPVEQSPQFRRRILTDACTGFVQRKLDKLEAPPETFLRAEASYRGIKDEQLVTKAEAVPGGLVIRSQA